MLGGRDPEALVGDAEAHAAVRVGDAELDRAAVGRVLDRVLDEVLEHEQQFLGVGDDGRDAAVVPQRELETGREPMLPLRDDPASGGDTVDRGEVELHPPRHDLVGGQDHLDEARESRGLRRDHVEQIVLQLRVEILARERQGRAVDRSDRRP